MQEELSDARFELDSLVGDYDPFRKSREGEFPSPLDPDLRSALQAGINTISDYDSRISEAYSLIHRLQERKRTAQHYTAACATLAAPSPIRQVPYEVLAQIFTHYCGEEYISLGYQQTKKGRLVSIKALILRHVCSHWRRIVESTPGLTSRISLQLSADVLTAEILDIVAQIFELSKPSRALNVRFRTGEARGDKDRSELLRCFSRETLTRLEFLELRDFMGILIQPANTFNVLSSLKLDWHPPDGMDPVDISHAAPNLRSLEIYNDPRWLVVNWNHLHSIAFAQCSAAYAFATLAQCTELELLEVHACYAHEDIRTQLESSTTPIILSRVKTLVQNICSQDFFMCLFSSLVSLPSLSFWVLSFSIGGQSYDVSSLIINFNCIITTLNIVTTHRHPATVLEALFKKCSTLEVLNLSVRCIDWEAYHDEEGLLPISIGAILDSIRWPNIPELQQLELNITPSNFDEPDSIFVELIQRRWMEDRLKSVLIELHNDGNDRTFTGSWVPYGKMKKEGLQIEIIDDHGCVSSRA